METFPRYWPFVRTKASDAELWCFFDLRPNKRLRKQSRGWWFETPSRPLWRHCNAHSGEEANASPTERSAVTLLVHLYHLQWSHNHEDFFLCLLLIPISLNPWRGIHMVYLFQQGCLCTLWVRTFGAHLCVLEFCFLVGLLVAFQSFFMFSVVLFPIQFLVVVLCLSGF